MMTPHHIFLYPVVEEKNGCITEKRIPIEKISRGAA
jgi:hypothetical protein